MAKKTKEIILVEDLGSAILKYYKYKKGSVLIDSLGISKEIDKLGKDYGWKKMSFYFKVAR